MKTLTTLLLLIALNSYGQKSIVRIPIEERTPAELIYQGASMNQTAILVQVISVTLGALLMIDNPNNIKPASFIIGVGTVASITLRFKGFGLIKIGAKKL